MQSVKLVACDRGGRGRDGPDEVVQLGCVLLPGRERVRALVRRRRRRGGDGEDVPQRNPGWSGLHLRPACLCKQERSKVDERRGRGAPTRRQHGEKQYRRTQPIFDPFPSFSELLYATEGVGSHERGGGRGGRGEVEDSEERETHCGRSDEWCAWDSWERGRKGACVSGAGKRSNIESSPSSRSLRLLAPLLRHIFALYALHRIAHTGRG